MLHPHFDRGEQVITTQRKHWIFIAFRLAALSLAAMVPPIAGGVLLAFPDVPVTQSGLLLFLIAYCLWLLAVLIFAAYSWTVWVLDLWIVTDRKFIDIEQRTLFHRHVSTLTLEKVQDVTVKVDGLFATWLDFGTVIVQTAGQEREFVIHGIRRPYKFKEILLSACQEHNEQVKATPDGVASTAA